MNIMTSEEYLNRYKVQNGYGGYDVTEDDALEAVKMARKEERKKQGWHDLKKCPQDLPKPNKYVIVRYISYVSCILSHGIASYRYNQDDQDYEWIFNPHQSYLEILSWHDIPEFKE